MGDVRVKWFFWVGEKGDFLTGVGPYCLFIFEI